MLEILQIINLVLIILTAAIALLTALVKPFRAWILGRYQNNETDRCLLRNEIVEVYYKHYHECEMRLYEYENLEKLYKQYKKLGGNSFIDKIWEEVQDWRIDQ